MNTLQLLSFSSTDVPERATVPLDLIVVSAWSALGLGLTALVFVLGFGSEIGQALIIAG